MSKIEQITYLGEIQRKSIHIVSLLIPIIYYFIDTKSALLILFPVAILTLLIDLGIYFSDTFKKIMYPIVGGMLRPHEMHRTSLVLNGASWVEEVQMPPPLAEDWPNYGKLPRTFPH